MTYIWFYPEGRCGPTHTARSSVTSAAPRKNWITFETFFTRHIIMNRVRSWLSKPARDLLAGLFSGPPRILDLGSTLCPRLVGSLLIAVLSGVTAAVILASYDQPLTDAVVTGCVASLIIAFLLYSASPICKISVCFLHAGEPFPFVERSDTLSGKEHVFAVRLLSWNAHSRYNPFWHGDKPQPLPQRGRGDVKTPSPGFANQYFHSDTLSTQFDRKSRFETDALPDYWSLLYFSLARQLRSESGRRSGEVYRIGGLLNRGSILLYILMLASVLLLTWFGFFRPDGSPLNTQFPLVAGIAVLVWAAVATSLHRRRILGLTRWEAACKRHPFLNCPLFMAVPDTHNGVVWEELRTTSFDDPIATFGPDVENVVKIVATAMVVILLTLLQLIK